MTCFFVYFSKSLAHAACTQFECFSLAHAACTRFETFPFLHHHSTLHHVYHNDSSAFTTTNIAHAACPRFDIPCSVPTRTLHVSLYILSFSFALITLPSIQYVYHIHPHIAHATCTRFDIFITPAHARACFWLGEFVRLPHSGYPRLTNLIIAALHRSSLPLFPCEYLC